MSLFRVYKNYTRRMDESDTKEEIRAFCQIIGKTIATERKGHKITQDELAHRAGYHRTYMGVVERGEKTPTLWTLKKIAAELKMKPSELLAKAGF